MSTNGSLLYRIEQRPPQGSKSYRALVYDFVADELRPELVADKRDLETDMTWRPMARATSNDGVWVFTHYRGAKHAFVHALNVDHEVDAALGRRAPAGWYPADRDRLVSSGA